MKATALLLAFGGVSTIALVSFAFTFTSTTQGPLANDTGPGFDGGTSLDATTCTDDFQDVCAPSGQPGCAGNGGQGGSGGGGGGAAIALLASGSTTTVTLENGAMIAGYGGNGGPGGGGQQGASGNTGIAGMTVLCYGLCSASCPINGGLEGGAGGVGGQGGTGGTGGGGAGGPHYFYAEVGGAKVTPSTSTLSASGFANTTAGVGGLPNGLDGGQGQHP